jgi:type II secretory ATPase GspE/PulE/Tfp pilus assembly ATPase PilB-like protein
LATLGAHDAAGAFPALAALGISPNLAAETVRMTVAQRLLRRICTDCAEAMAPPKSLLDELQYRPFDNIPQTQFSHGRGCAACRNTGYRGRVACAEALRNSPEIQYLLAEGAPAGRLKRQALDEGMISMRQDALAKAARGLSTLEEVAARTIADHTEDRVT